MRALRVESRLAVEESGGTVNHQNHGVTPQSPWHSPVPYLFGGLAAMLGLIAFALLILACSYWRLSSSPQQDDAQNVDEEKESRSGVKAENGAYEDKFLVIVAGEDLPRFIATPALKKCTCGVHQGNMVLSLDHNVVTEAEKKMSDGEDEPIDTGEPITTTH